MTFGEYKKELRNLAPLDAALASKVLAAAVKDPAISAAQFHQLELVYFECREVQR